jgi:hypothetical protein
VSSPYQHSGFLKETALTQNPNPSTLVEAPEPVWLLGEFVIGAVVVRAKCGQSLLGA